MGAEQGGTPVEEWRGTESLRELVEARDRKQDYSALRAAFERANGTIVNSWFAERGKACVVITEAGHRGRRRQVLVLIGNRPAALQVPAFDDAIWRAIWLARLTEQGSDRLVTRGGRAVVANLLFTVMVFLLGTLDHVCGSDVAAAPQNGDRLLLTGAADAARTRLDEVERYLEEAEVRAAVRCYLIGLPVGIAAAVVGGIVLWLIDRSQDPAATANLLAITACAGGLGAVASVMFRVTNGQHLSVDAHQGIAVTVAAGAFRTLIGSVFGVVLFVLVQAGLLPLDPTHASGPAMFYTGLAFLAGFSERWAQDTILRSAPLATAQGAASGTAVGETLVHAAARPSRTVGSARGRRRSSVGHPRFAVPADNVPTTGNGASGLQ